MSKKYVYTVHAYRWGDREMHSYSVGVYSKKLAAMKAAGTEREWRGGKYECEVLEWVLDRGSAGASRDQAKVIVALPGNTLRAALPQSEGRSND